MRKKSSFKPPYLKNIVFHRSKAVEVDAYPLSLPIFQNDFDLELTKPVTIFVGDNGSGKSTLMEYIAYISGFNLLGGSSDHLYATLGRESHEHMQQLKSCMRLSWLPKVSKGFFLRAETFYNFLEYIHDPEWQDLETSYGGNLLRKSHGEGFLALFSNRFQRSGIYLLDEPEAALSPRRQLDFLKILHQINQRQDSQVILITHSPILMSYPDADLFAFSHHGIEPTYLEAVDQYRFVRDFLNNPDVYLDELLQD